MILEILSRHFSHVCHVELLPFLNIESILLCTSFSVYIQDRLVELFLHVRVELAGCSNLLLARYFSVHLSQNIRPNFNQLSLRLWVPSILSAAFYYLPLKTAGLKTHEIFLVVSDTGVVVVVTIIIV